MEARSCAFSNEVKTTKRECGIVIIYPSRFFMDFQNLILLFIAILNFIFSFLIIFKHKSLQNTFFALFSLNIALWAMFLALYRKSVDPIYAQWLLVGAYLSALCIALSFWLFARAFLHKSFKNLTTILLIVVWFTLFILTIYPNFLVQGVKITTVQHVGILSVVGYIIYSIFFIGYFFGGLLEIGKKLVSSVGIERTQLQYIFWSVLIGGIWGSFFNLILPSPFFINFNYIWIGPIFTAGIVIFTGYAIAKHHLLEIKVISTELVVFAFSVFFILRIFLSGGSQETVFRIISTAIVLVFAFLLIRAVLGEVKQREGLEGLADKLKTANKKLKALDEAKSNFISLASHQLRTPIAAIKGYLSMLLEGDFGHVSKEQQTVLQKNTQSIDQLNTLVSTFLDMSRIEAGRLSLDKQVIDLRDTLKAVVHGYHDAAHKKRLHLTLKLPKTPLTLEADQPRLREVFDNLVDNAIQYTPPGGQVEVKARALAKEITVTVADTGIGVNPAQRARLFDQYMRGGDDVARIDPSGAGVGLFIVKKLTEAHGGTVEVHSDGAGKGTTFVVSLPIGHADKKSLFESTEKSLQIKNSKILIDTR